MLYEINTCYFISFHVNTNGISILPCLSTSTLAAPARKKRTNFRASLFVSGKVFSLSSKVDHSILSYTNKQPSSPFVTTKLSPKASRNLAGMMSLPLVSIVVGKRKFYKNGDGCCCISTRMVSFFYVVLQKVVIILNIIYIFL